MKKLLHIISTPRSDDSRTLKVSQFFINGIKKKYSNCLIDELNLFKETLPALTIERINGKYTLLGGGELTGKSKEAWKEIEKHIQRFLSADAYLISAPMWNFSIPFVLKHYIDVIVQPKYLFQYTEKGPEGLVKDKKMVIVTARGGDYSLGSPFHQYDLQEPYLRTIFGFIGITDITFIYAQPMDALGPEAAREELELAKKIAQKTAEEF